MDYRIRIYIGEKIQDIALEEKTRLTIGSGKDNDCQIEAPGVREKHLMFFKRNGKWYISSDNASGQDEREIKDGDVFVLNQEKRIGVNVIARKTDVLQSLDIRNKQEVILGRGQQCDLVLPGNNISRKHAVIERQDGALVIRDNASLNGTFVNQRKLLEPHVLIPGDVIAIGSYHIHYRDGKLTVGEPENAFEEEVAVSAQSDTNGKAESKEKVPVAGSYPHWFKRTPRLKRELPTDKIQIQNPPQKASKPESNLVGSIASPLVMLIAGIVMAVVSVAAPIALIFTAPMSVLSIVMAIVTYRKQNRKYEQTEQSRDSKYGAYLEEMEARIKELKKKQILAMQQDSPSLEECLHIVEKRDIRLWDRRPEDGDFLHLRLGSGVCAASFEVKGQSESGFVMEEDYLQKRANELVENAGMLQGVPKECDLRTNSVAGIIGERRSTIMLAKNMIVQAAVHHAYDELKIAAVFSGREEQDWKWMRWLPHTFDDSRMVRYIASNRSSADEVFGVLEEVLKQRSLEAKKDKTFLPHYLVVCSEMELLEHHSIRRYLMQEEQDLGVSVILLFDEMRQLPKECSLIIETAHGKGSMYSKNNIDNRTKFQIDTISASEYDKMARSMAPLRLQSGTGDSSLPGMITFLEGYGVQKPQELDLDSRWKEGVPHQSMAVPIGIKAGGDPFFFDIHEKKYGPHGLVAGMTGSGKSEMVQSWILSMALQFSPQDVSFVLIDFKGTGLLLPFQNLPHLAGTISDLDSKIGRNLIALENELSRRKELLDKNNVNNITNYLKLYKAGKVEEPLPFLFVVIDEFAEFKVQFPEFMTVVDRIFAIGRTLGVFMLLLTQKPAGVVDDKMNANTRFRWCLKVASSEDSRDMLRHTDAAKLTNPGRAYVQVGEDEVYELIQSYYSGASYHPDSDKKATDHLRVAVLEETGKRTYYVNEEKEKAFQSEISEINAVVSYLHDYVEERGMKQAAQIWMPKLPDKIFLSDISLPGEEELRRREGIPRLVATVGMVDDPGRQSQYPLRLNFTTDGHMVVYGAPGTGKTTFLQSAVMSLLTAYTPEELAIYIMDFGSWSMGIFKDFPQVGGIANDNEEEKIQKMAQFLERMLNERKMKFSDVGVGSLQAYCQYTGEQLPNILLVLDNFGPVSQLYPDLDGFFLRLTREGGNYGIFLLISANNPLAMGYKLQQNIKMSLALQMTDKSDYQGIVGKTGGLEPENLEGRGLVKAMPPLEFQTALPAHGSTEAERIGKMKACAVEMNEKYGGKMAASIPVMPQEISFGSIPGEGFALGISTGDIAPVFLPEERTHYFPIVGLPGSGKSNALALLARQSAAISDAKVVYMDVRGSSEFLAKQERCTYLRRGEELDIYMEQLIPTLQQRKEAYDSGAGITFEPISIFVDDYRATYEVISELTARRLEQVVRLGAGLGVYLYIADDTETFARMVMQGELITATMARENSGILLGGNFAEHTSFSCQLPAIRKSQAVGRWEGYLLVKGEAEQLKMMKAR